MRNKKVILSSILSLVLCLSLIAGGTFALFTSETKTNIAINSGKVDLVATIENIETYSAMADAAGTIVDENGKTYTHVLQADNIFANKGTVTEKDGKITLDKMTPGDKVTFEIAIDNNSNVAIQYRTLITDADNGLLDALAVTIDGISYYGDVTAEWTSLEPNAAIAPIEVSIELPMTAGNEWQDKTVDLVVAVEAVQGNADTTQEALVFSADTVYAVTGIRANGSNGVLQATAGTLTINGNGTVNAEEGEDKFAMAVWANGGNVVINGGNYVQSFEPTDTQYDLIYASNGGNITIYGGSFKSATPEWTLNVKDADRANSHITVMGGRFYKFNPAEAQTGEGEITVPAGCEVVQNGDWYEVVPNFYKNAAGEYVINNVKGLKYFAETVNAGTDYANETVLLMNDIDLTGEDWTAISSFAGTFDGQNHTISNLTLDCSNDATHHNKTEYLGGLFGTITKTGSVKNLTLADASANLKGYFSIGMIANRMSGKAENCVVNNAAIVADGYLMYSGAMFGIVSGGAVIDQCSAEDVTITITGTDNGNTVGGLFGTINDNKSTEADRVQVTGVTIKNVTINASQKTKSFGGFAGDVYYATMKDCAVENLEFTVATNYQMAGGFAAAIGDGAQLENCVVSGAKFDIAGGGRFGGFAGRTYNWTDPEVAVSLKNCKVTGLDVTVSGLINSYVSGFCGNTNGDGPTTMENCSVTGVMDITGVTGYSTNGKNGVQETVKSDNPDNDSLDCLGNVTIVK